MAQRFLHFRGNIEHKLHELNLPRSASSENAHDIMGSPMQLLVDAKTVEEMLKVTVNCFNQTLQN